MSECRQRAMIYYFQVNKFSSHQNLLSHHYFYIFRMKKLRLQCARSHSSYVKQEFNPVWGLQCHTPECVHGTLTYKKNRSEIVAKQLHGMLLLLLSHFSHVQLCATPQTAAHEAPPSLGFSRQEHWSGLPFPSPMQESEK